jgi:glutaredoxin
MHQVTLYTRAGCHLCDVARDAVVPVCTQNGARYREVDVDADPEDRAEYGDRVPVVVVDGVEHGYFEVDADRLRRALTG